MAPSADLILQRIEAARAVLAGAPRRGPDRPKGTSRRRAASGPRRQSAPPGVDAEFGLSGDPGGLSGDPGGDGPPED